MSVEMGPDGGRSETGAETLAAVEKRAAVALEDWA